MIQADRFYNVLVENTINFFTGVPDSQLKPFCDYITKKLGIGKKHIIAANEGNAVALAAGHYIATGNIGLVYMQNSGLGNAVNPITSLTDSEVYGIPLLYLIGWRGQPGVKDEPQHIKQGKITKELLEILDIENYTLTTSTTIEDIELLFKEKINDILNKGKSVAFVVEKGVFEEKQENLFQNEKIVESGFELSREEAINVIVSFSDDNDVVVSTTGKASRELFESREKNGQSHERDFLTVGSMGHASMIALGIEENSKKRVWCIDGDGAILMHTGAAALIGSRKPKRYIHVLINNGVHESVGGMPTISYDIDWKSAVKAFGYRNTYSVDNRIDLENILNKIKFEEKDGPIFLEILTNASSRDNLTRPTIKPIDNKNNMMNLLRKGN